MTVLPNEDDSKFQLRSYQQEMVELSLRENCIVQMDTGSGKTAIAIARTEAALKEASPEKIVWLTAPTTTLCEQHSETFEKRLPAFQIRLLLGKDGIDKWSDQQTWDAALKNIRIVISVSAVLNDALSHAFVKIERIALLIFDEAHHCLKNNPGAQIMRNFYFKAPRTTVPRILGLSASPATNEKKANDLRELLDSPIVTPSRCRSELKRHVHRPKVQLLFHGRTEVSKPHSLLLLENAIQRYNIEEEEKTQCQKVLEELRNKAVHVYEQLGADLADWYVNTAVSKILGQFQGTRRGNVTSEWLPEERKRLSDILTPLTIQTTKRESDKFWKHPLPAYSPKVEKLIQFLENEWTKSFTGLVFVQQRVLAYVLSSLLLNHPFKRAKLRIHGFVGTSGSSKRSSTAVEDILMKGQETALRKFRSPDREINLLVATEVLGEGVDVPQCHLVICFDPPPQLTSYIQKRGRARLQDSKYMIMLEEGGDPIKIAKWQQVEESLDAEYLAADRERKESQMLEDRHDPGSEKEFRTPIGAVLNLDNAIPKINHFCNTLLTGSFGDLRPQLAFKHLNEDQITAVITLPIVVDPSLRVTHSSRPWRTEKMAGRDAAYEALKRLYDFGLLNEHLLPLKPVADSGVEDEGQKEAGLCYVLPRINPWLSVISKPWTNGLWKSLKVRIERLAGGEAIDIFLLAHAQLSSIQEFTLYWNQDIRYSVHGELSDSWDIHDDNFEKLWKTTDAVLRSAHGTRMPTQKQYFPFGIMPCKTGSTFQVLGTDAITLTIEEYRQLCPSDPGVVWHDGLRYLFHQFSTNQNAETGEITETVLATAYPKRRDFTHPALAMKDSYTKQISLPLVDCTFEPLDYKGAMVSLFMPSILRRFELSLIAEELRSKVLYPVKIQNLLLLQTAITHQAALESENYQRLEFFGDTILGYLISVHLMAEYPFWPEGYLSSEKGQRVSNRTLQTACRRLGVDRYIISDLFTGSKWVPPYVPALIAKAEEPDEMVYRSSKMIADVVESTIAAAYVDSGMLSAVECCKIYFPDQKWTAPDHQAKLLFEAAGDEIAHLEGLEELVGYKFKKPSLLLEGTTSSSFQSYNNSTARSYQRLEFLGDTVLGYLVVKRIYAFNILTPDQMTSIKAAVVNSWILGYLCMRHSITEERDNIVVSQDSSSWERPKVEQIAVNKYIWQFLRHSQSGDWQSESLGRYEDMSEDIQSALESGKSYPWDLMSRFAPNKMFCDLIESILGAIFVDSNANEGACDAFLERIGVYKILDRILRDGVNTTHPKAVFGVAAGNRSVQYEWGEDGELFTCQIKLNDENIGGLAKGMTRDATACQAALEAAKILQEDNYVTTEEGAELDDDSDISMSQESYVIARDW